MVDQGALQLTLDWDGLQIVAARIASTRPLAAQLLLGQPAGKAVALVPRLFSLCGKAQGAAARLALGAARGEQAGEAALQDSARAVALEAIGEHLWRLLLDWPPMCGQAVRKDEFLGWRNRLQAVSSQAEAATLGAGLLAWLAEQTLPTTMQENTQTVGRLLPWIGAAQWARQWIDEDFSLRPAFDGQPAETGVLARRRDDTAVAALYSAGQGVAARLAARYADLRFLAASLLEPQGLAGWLEAAPVDENIGLARVETARGLLLHLMQIKEGRVDRYIIVAPTEWNFHPQGAFTSEIVGCPASTRNEAEVAARRLALALDPCVACEIVVNKAAENA